MPEHPTDAHFLFTFVFKQALNLPTIEFGAVCLHGYFLLNQRIDLAVLAKKHIFAEK